ncbi:hypothetical protein EI171_26040 [Bradyrhizobium sp. LCT2]|uniref:DUF4339 domain-containing protein n=1 Tax=Bradyrhizobium sp. LCT2 TaxID=2493093 RepID=UPI001373DFBF|nr:DUF4339 domain-containing protein [Bradyrhizobium sp. LCT2]QHP70445.1 hypothetical protein EI171_26040 [Bradyrhizobium sp. LCT2]
MSAWYYVDEHRQTIGPLPRERLISLLREMARPGDVFVWQAGFDAWKKVSQVEELLPPLAAIPPPPPELQPGLALSADDSGGGGVTKTATRAKDALQAIGGYMLVMAVGIGFVTLLMMLFYGATWASENLLRYVSLAAQWAIVTCIVILAPLAVFRRTRIISAFGFFSSSYIFGTCLWMMGLLSAYFYWGLKSIIIGMCLFGVGVVPVALLASLFNSDWTAIAMMLTGVALTYGTRMLALWMFEKV